MGDTAAARGGPRHGALRRRHRGRRRDVRGARRRDPRGHRSERRRQDHALRHHHGSAPTHRGRVVLDGVDVTARSAVWRSRHGVRRTFQRQQPFGWLSVEDNIVAALDWRGGGGGIVADLLAAEPPPPRSRSPGPGARGHGDLRAARRARRAGGAPVDRPGAAWSSSPVRSRIRRGCCCSTSRRRGSRSTKPRTSAAIVRELRVDRGVRRPAGRARRGVRDGAVRPHHRAEPRRGHRWRHTERGVRRPTGPFGLSRGDLGHNCVANE